MTRAEAVFAILDELDRAETLHPSWPTDHIHQAAIVAEEAGELVRAALNHTYHGEDAEEMRKEAIQTGAMAIRFLVNLPNK
jgi:predicted transcriptional regulator